MVFDYHVHVTGSMFHIYNPNVIESINDICKLLRTSLKENNIYNFLGIISSGTFYKKPGDFNEAINTNIGLLFDEAFFCKTIKP